MIGLQFPGKRKEEFAEQCSPESKLQSNIIIHLQMWWLSVDDPTNNYLEAAFPLWWSDPFFPTPDICTSISLSPTSSNIQISPILTSLPRTKAIHPPQKVCTIRPLVSGTELTVQHSPFKLRRTISVLHFGRCAIENWYGIFCIKETGQWMTSDNAKNL